MQASNAGATQMMLNWSKVQTSPTHILLIYSAHGLLLCQQIR